MLSSLQRLAKRLAQKLAAGLLIIALGLAACGWWLYWRDKEVSPPVKPPSLVELNHERQRTSAALDGIDQQMAGMQTELVQQQAREQMADRSIAELRELRNWWDRWFGDREKQRAYADQLARAEQLKQDIATREVALRVDLKHAQWEKDGCEIELDRLDRKIHAAEAGPPPLVYYLALAWDKMKWSAVAVLGLCFFGPALGKLFLFFGLARLIEGGRPVRLAEDLFALPQVGEAGPLLDTSVWPGERLWVKEAFLQSADESLWRRTRFMLDWRIPFTCFLCGLFDLVALRNTRAGRDFRATFACDGDPAAELALVSVPEGGSLVLRPSFLKAVILSGEARLKIRRHWRFFNWRSWIALQFRFFEFAGPCRLLVASSRGVRAERLTERDGQLRPARCANQAAIIGFTPNLDYGLVRAGRFRAYFRNQSPLFDDLFTGPGLFLCQRPPANGVRKFWSGDVLKILGM